VNSSRARRNREATGGNSSGEPSTDPFHLLDLCLQHLLPAPKSETRVRPALGGEVSLLEAANAAAKRREFRAARLVGIVTRRGNRSSLSGDIGVERTLFFGRELAAPPFLDAEAARSSSS
jgi:hypothetical protein